VTRAEAPPAVDAALAGSPAARRLLREAPERLGRLDVVGPAGTGKSVLLHALADVMERAGFTVLRELPDDPGPQVALLVDDAHRLSPADLTRLTTLAEGEVGVLVVAHRPWPRPDGMSALGAALAVPRAPLVLGALDRSGVQARVAHVLGDRGPRPPDAVVELVLTQTGGHPALVDRMLAALIELGGADPTRWRWDPSRPPSSSGTWNLWKLAACFIRLARVISLPQRFSVSVISAATA